MERGPVLVVAACIVRGETVLLARRNQPDVPEAHLKWELPGGKVRLGETPQEAVRREIQEELRTTINVVRLLPHLQTNLYHRSDGTTGHFLVVAFESVIAKGATKPEPSDESVKQFEWVSRDEVKTLSLLPGTDRFIECIIDLWGEYNLLERHVNFKRRSTQSKVITDVSQANLWERLTARVRDLAQQGYVVSESTTTLLEPLGHGA
jgi:8-oxo-dGTP diphosphatase